MLALGAVAALAQLVPALWGQVVPWVRIGMSLTLVADVGFHPLCPFCASGATEYPDRCWLVMDLVRIPRNLSSELIGNG